MPRNAQAHMCRRESQREYRSIPVYINLYQAPSIPYSSETLCSIEVSEGLKRTGNHVLYQEKSKG
jgi:hypothetical protein